MKLLLWLKLFICKIGYGDRLTEFCQECGRTTDLVWWAPDALWLELTGERHGGGVRCTACFDRTATRRGIILRWRPEVAHRLATRRFDVRG